ARPSAWVLSPPRLGVSLAIETLPPRALPLSGSQVPHAAGPRAASSSCVRPALSPGAGPRGPAPARWEHSCRSLCPVQQTARRGRSRGGAAWPLAGPTPWWSGRLPASTLPAMQEILEAIQEGAPGDEIAALPIPESYRAAHVLRSEQDMWEGVPSEEKDPRKSLHVGEVPTPELAPDEVYLAVMASSINFNTVWTSIFEPLPTFGFLDRLGRESVWGARHARDYHVVGSDASGVVLRVGSAVRNWKPGDRVVVHCNYVDDQDPSAHDDSMLAAN